MAVIDPEYLKGRKVYGQIVCSFRYGREEDEVMGLEFQKDLLMASGEIQPKQKKDLSKMQVTINLLVRVEALINWQFGWNLIYF